MAWLTARSLTLSPAICGCGDDDEGSKVLLYEWRVMDADLGSSRTRGRVAMSAGIPRPNAAMGSEDANGAGVDAIIGKVLTRGGLPSISLAV